MRTTNKNYKVKKILNNSSLIVTDFFHEIVLIGRGIAFGLSAGDILDKGTKYDQSYQSINNMNQFTNLISGYSDVTIRLVMDTIQLIVEEDKNEFTPNELLSISDHLAAAYTRIQRGEAIKSFFSFETKALYPCAFSRAYRISQTINLKYNIDIPDAEICYIALHIHNLNSETTKQNTEMLTAIISDIYDLLTVVYKFDLEANSNNYLKFLTHLRFLVEGALNTKIALNDDVNNILEKSYPEHSEAAQKIKKIIESHLKVVLSEKEVYYLLIHLVNISQENEEL